MPLQPSDFLWELLLCRTQCHRCQQNSTAVWYIRGQSVVVTTVGCIFLIYVLVVIWARRKDIQDDAKVSLQLIKSMYSGQFPPSLACFNRKSLTNPTPFPVILCLLVSKYCSQDDKFLLTAFRNLYLQDC